MLFKKLYVSYVRLYRVNVTYSLVFAGVERHLLDTDNNVHLLKPVTIKAFKSMFYAKIINN